MIINIPSETDLSGFYIVYEGSTLIETEKNWGIAHLCEHLMCHSFEHLQDEFEQNAINWNAYTSNNEIVFHFTGLDDKLKPYKSMIVDLLSTYVIPEHRFLHERKIVLEEYLDVFNEQTGAHYENLNRKLHGHYSPIGSKRALEGLTIEDVHQFAAVQYKRPTKIINVSKHSPFAGFNYFNSLIIDHSLSKPSEFEFEPSNDYRDKSSVIIAFQPSLENFTYNRVINEILCSGLNSPLYQEVREKRGLVYGISMFQGRIGKYGMNYIMASTSDEKVNELISVVEDVLTYPELYLTEKRFEIVKDAITTRERIKLINRAYNVHDLIAPGGWDLAAALPSMTYEGLLNVFKSNYDLNNAKISVDKMEFTETVVE